MRSIIGCLTVATLPTANSPGAIGFDHEVDLGIPNPMMARCTQQTLSPGLVIQNCAVFLKWFQDVDAPWAIRAQAQALYFMGTAYVRAGRSDAATKTFRLALGVFDRIVHEIQLGTMHDQEEMAQILNNRCWIKAISGIELETALADCDQALAIRSNYPDTLDGKAFTLYRLRKYKEALAAYDEIVTAHASYASALFMRGVTKFVLNDDKGGDADIRAARQSDSHIDAIYAGYGVKLAN